MRRWKYAIDSTHDAYHQSKILLPFILGHAPRMKHEREEEVIVELSTRRRYGMEDGWMEGRNFHVVICDSVVVRLVVDNEDVRTKGWKGREEEGV